MEGENALSNTSAARMIASAFGALAGLGGLIHGIGEVLQGNVAPRGLFIDSWTQGPIAIHMGGDPGMTIVPNLLITGVLTIVVSMVTITWAVAFVQTKYGGTVLVLLSVAMLLVGGGVGPPIIGVLAGIAGTSINGPLRWWRIHLSVGTQCFFAKMWRWVFGISLINGVFLFIGAIILVYSFAWGNADLYFSSFLFALVSLPLSIITGIGYDLQSGEPGSLT